MADSTQNPYVGPRTFTRQESNRFFGREREAQELCSLVISERLTLFYAQSGAGKSSLINTRLAPLLEEAGFVVLPISRVSGDLPPEVKQVSNIFIFNLMLSLERGSGAPSRLVDLSLADFLARLTSTDGENYCYDPQAELDGEADDAALHHVLIIDQFEEIITTHPERWTDREDFFRQLNGAMAADPLLWVVLTLREDYVAALDPYAHLLAGKLQARFYMQRMGSQAALEATRRPAAQYGRPFAPGVAETLIDNLRQIRVPDQRETQPGEFIEPVQLQVVCFQLWESLGPDSAQTEITEADLIRLAGGRDLAQFVDRALAKFYADAIDLVSSDEPGRTEFDLHNWFESQLITPAKTRALVLQDPQSGAVGGLPKSVIAALEKLFLIRAESRAGGTWYELVHDRFIDPILQANWEWQQNHPLIIAARDWQKTDWDESKLYQGEPLAVAFTHPDAKIGLVKEFLAESRKAETAREEAIKREQRHQVLKWTIGIIGLLAVAAIAAAVVAVSQANLAYQNAGVAVQQEGTANAERSAADKARETAQAAQVKAEAERDSAAAAEFNAQQQRATAEAAGTESAQRFNSVKGFATETFFVKQTLESEQSKSATLAANLAAVLTAQAQAPTATATPTPLPTPSPAATDGSSEGTEPDDTPTPTVTPTTTPEEAGKATVAAAQSQLAQVQAEQTAVAQTLATSSAISFPPPGQIVFVSDRLSQADLYIMNGDGSNVIRLTGQDNSLDVNPLYPKPSYGPGQRHQLIFSSKRSDRLSLTAINLAGQDPVDIGGREWDNWDPSFAQDGQQLTLVSSRSGRPEIYTMQLDGSEAQLVTNDLVRAAIGGPVNIGSPVWSPNGRRIAFVVSEREAQSDIWLVNADGTNPVRLTRSGSVDANPVWSPDSRQLAFVSTRDGNAEIYLADLLSGGAERNLTNSPFDENYPAWSLDGNWLAFSRYTTNNEIFVMTLDGNNVTNLTNNSSSDWSPVWTP